MTFSVDSWLGSMPDPLLDLLVTFSESELLELVRLKPLPDAGVEILDAVVAFVLCVVDVKLALEVATPEILEIVAFELPSSVGGIVVDEFASVDCIVELMFVLLVAFEVETNATAAVELLEIVESVLPSEEGEREIDVGAFVLVSVAVVVGFVLETFPKLSVSGLAVVFVAPDNKTGLHRNLKKRIRHALTFNETNEKRDRYEYDAYVARTTRSRE